VRAIKVIAGIPVEILRRLLGIKWTLDRTITHYDALTGKTLTAWLGMWYDRFTLFPDLRKKDGTPSDGSPVHDAGWIRGTWDDGTILLFADNNRVLRDILTKEEHKDAIVDAVDWGVGLGIMRDKWRKTHGHE